MSTPNNNNMQSPQGQTLQGPVVADEQIVVYQTTDASDPPFYHKFWFYVLLIVITALLFFIIGVYGGRRIERIVLKNKIGSNVIQGNLR